LGFREGVETVVGIAPVWISVRAVAATFALAEPLAAFAEVLGRAALVGVAPGGPATVVLQTSDPLAEIVECRSNFGRHELISAAWANRDQPWCSR
jgi:hypothetical protein